MILVSSLRCPCGEEADDDLKALRDEMGGLCQDCYESSMEAAYNDLPEVFREDLNDS